MAWRFCQSTGLVYKDDKVDHMAYSGHGLGLDNPAMQSVKDVGPLPQGWYTIGPLFNSEKLGKDVMQLTPDSSTVMFGRSAMYWHGDEIEHAGEHLASDGCIVSPHDARLRVGNSGDSRLYVYAGS